MNHPVSGVQVWTARLYQIRIAIISGPRDKHWLEDFAVFGSWDLRRIPRGQLVAEYDLYQAMKLPLQSHSLWVSDPHQLVDENLLSALRRSEDFLIGNSSRLILRLCQCRSGCYESSLNGVGPFVALSKPC